MAYATEEEILERRAVASKTLNSCPVITTLHVIGGKWKPGILWAMLQGQDAKRFGQLHRAIPGITQKMLTQQLRELEDDGIIWRRVYAEVPPRVEYDFTDYGLSLVPLLQEMARWGCIHQSAGLAKETIA